MELQKECFGPLWQFIEDETITDMDYSGGRLWLTDTDNRRYPAPEEVTAGWMNDSFVEQFSQRIANLVSVQFNRQRPELEAETPDLRVTIVHESAARSGRCISIRKTPPLIRMSAQKILAEKYTQKEILALLINCVSAGFNMSFCGMPGSGKTECLKFFSTFIPAEDRVITIEDTMEIRYKASNPGKDCIEMKVNEKVFDYTAAIKASLRLNPKWIMLSEARSREVKYLLESWSTGVSGMTTIHTDHVRNIPDRILNMLENRQDADRLENDIYRVIDVGVLIRRMRGEDGKIHRCIDQLCFFLRENRENKVCMVVNQGEWTCRSLPESLQKRFERLGITDPFSSELLEQRLWEESCSRREERGLNRPSGILGKTDEIPA